MRGKRPRARDVTFVVKYCIFDHSYVILLLVSSQSFLSVKFLPCLQLLSVLVPREKGARTIQHAALGFGFTVLLLRIAISSDIILCIVHCNFF